MTTSAPGPIDGHMMQVSRLDSARMAGNSRKPTPLKPVARSGSTPAGAVHNPSLMGLAVTAPAAALSAVGRAMVSVATKAVDPPQLRPLTWVVTRHRLRA
jgi:hypothetical protein